MDASVRSRTPQDSELTRITALRTQQNQAGETIRALSFIRDLPDGEKIKIVASHGSEQKAFLDGFFATRQEMKLSTNFGQYSGADVDAMIEHLEKKGKGETTLCLSLKLLRQKKETLYLFDTQEQAQIYSRYSNGPLPVKPADLPPAPTRPNNPGCSLSSRLRGENGSDRMSKIDTDVARFYYRTHKGEKYDDSRLAKAKQYEYARTHWVDFATSELGPNWSRRESSSYITEYQNDMINLENYNREWGEYDREAKLYREAADLYSKTQDAFKAAQNKYKHDLQVITRYFPEFLNGHEEHYPMATSLGHDR
ncbi:MAG: hypothetical protein PHH14_05455 [Candidatus Margulisbacteria bacterium]|nr:hypothetical protein [Candidatus Margulisiibacteriota bacterium]